MASVNFVPYQDPDNAVHGEPEKIHGGRRIISKTFVQDGIPHATPRRALGDVKNLKSHQAGSAIKMPQSARKLKPSNINTNSKAGFGSAPRQNKSSFSIKTDNKKEMKVFEDAQAVKEEQTPIFSEKECMFPFKDKELEFEMPAYLSTVLQGKFLESAWWPSFTESTTKSQGFDCDFDLTNIKLEELSPHEDIEEPSICALPNEVSNLESHVLATVQVDVEDGNIASLQDLEQDLNEIDAFYNF